MPLNLLPRPEGIRAALLASQPPQPVYSISEAVDRLRAAGLRLPEGQDEAEDLVIDAVDADGQMLLPLADGEIMDLTEALDGVVLSHRLSRPEVLGDVLGLDADLPGPAYMHILASGLTCPGGAVVNLDEQGAPGPEWADRGALPLQLPRGTYAALGVGAGSLVGVDFAAGIARLVRVDEASLAAPDDLLEVLLEAAEDDLPDVDEMFDTVLSEPGALRGGPFAPVSELLAQAGLTVEDDLVMDVGPTALEARAHRLAEQLRADYDLDESDAAAVAAAVGTARAIEAILLDAVDELEDDAELAGDGIGAGDHPEDPAPLERGGRDAVHGLGQPDAGVPESWDDEDPNDVAFARIEEVLDAQSAALGAVAQAVASPWLVHIIASELLDRSDPAPAGLDVLTDVLGGEGAPPTSRAQRAGLEYLHGRVLEVVGDPLAAETSFREVLRLVPGHPLALTSLAGIALDRGQAAKARSLLDQAEAPEDHPLRTALERSRAQSAQAAGSRVLARNAPCWCGSGRKYKACHARVVAAPLRDRAIDLLGRAIAWLILEDAQMLHSLLVLSQAAGGGSDPDDTLEELAVDAVLFEGGALAEYLRVREPLLVADELMLAQSWLLQRRSVFEVVGVEPGVGLDLRNLADGERVSLPEEIASRTLSVGSFVLTRLADMGGHPEPFGGIFVVPLAHRDAAMELLDADPEPIDLVLWLAQLSKPPTLVTPEGDTLEPVSSTFTTRNPDLLARQLDELFERDDERTWSLPGDEGPMGRRIMGVLTLDGGRLSVVANSRRRFDELLARLAAVEEELTETSHEVLSMADVIAAAQADEGTDGAGEAGGGTGIPGRGSGSGFIGPDEIGEHPEMEAALARQIAAYERRWLDESIPALGGVTPRQAADDPTRREDLVRLLDTFPSGGSPTEMDGGRIKRMLGL